MHRVRNSGSFLQAYATQAVLRSLSCRCEIIDYQYPNYFHTNDVNWISENICPKLNTVIKSIFYHRDSRFSLIERLVFAIYINHYLNLSRQHFSSPEELEAIGERYDILILGSDQTLNPRFICHDKSFLLGFSKTSKKISFSSSIPCSHICETDKLLYQQYLSQFDHISVRENNGKTLLESILNKSINVTIDPVFLISKEQWIKRFHIHKCHKKYILFLVYGYMTDSIKENVDKLESLYNATKYDIISAGGICLDIPIKAKTIRVMSPKKFINLIANASYVITDSFHATAFSIIFNRQFIPAISDISSDDRIYNVLRYCSMDKNGIYQYSDTKKDKLNNDIRLSIDYLRRAIYS